MHRDMRGVSKAFAFVAAASRTRKPGRTLKSREPILNPRILNPRILNPSILNPSMIFSTKCNVWINLRSMVRSIAPALRSLINRTGQHSHVKATSALDP